MRRNSALYQNQAAANMGFMGYPRNMDMYLQKNQKRVNFQVQSGLANQMRSNVTANQMAQNLTHIENQNQNEYLGRLTIPALNRMSNKWDQDQMRLHTMFQPGSVPNYQQAQTWQQPHHQLNHNQIKRQEILNQHQMMMLQRPMHGIPMVPNPGTELMPNMFMPGGVNPCQIGQRLVYDGQLMMSPRMMPFGVMNNPELMANFNPNNYPMPNPDDFRNYLQNLNQITNSLNQNNLNQNNLNHNNGAGNQYDVEINDTKGRDNSTISKKSKPSSEIGLELENDRHCLDLRTNKKLLKKKKKRKLKKKSKGKVKKKSKRGKLILLFILDLVFWYYTKENNRLSN